MSLLKMVPMQRNWLSRLLMMAAKSPAAKKPLRIAPVWVFTRNGRILLESTTPLAVIGRGGFEGINEPVAQAPIRTQGNQTIRMKIGWQTTGSLKLDALRAVIQCWKTCGNMPTESGIKR